MCSRVFGTRSMRCVWVVVAWAQKTVKRWRFRYMIRGDDVPRAHAGLAESPCVHEARPWGTCFGCVCSPIVRQPIPRGGVFHKRDEYQTPGPKRCNTVSAVSNIQL